MKYLAILKDSLREAIDTKVLYVMVAFSLLFILFAATIGFAPLPPEEAFPAMVKSSGFRMAWPDRGKNLIPGFSNYLSANLEVDNIKQLTDARSYTNRDYTFTLTVKESAPGSFHQLVDYWSKPAPENAPFGRGRPHFAPNVKGDPAVRVPPAMMEEFIKDQFASGVDLTVRQVKVQEIQSPDAKADGQMQSGIYSFAVETEGRSGVRGWPENISLAFGAIDPQSGFLQAPPGMFIYLIENVLINTIGGWVALMVGIVITAFFIPNMLRKGTIDMLLAKPIHRPVLLIYKYVGGLTFMLLNSVVAIGGIWLMIGMRSGVWTNGFFCTIFTLTFFFAILYSVSTLFAVLTRSTIVAILMTILVWFVLYLVGTVYQLFNSIRNFNEPPWRDDIATWIFSGVDGLHFVLPRTSDLGAINAQLVAEVMTDHDRRIVGVAMLPDINWTESIAVSLVFIAVMLAVASWRFSRKDF